MGINYKGVSTNASKLTGLLDGDRLPDVSEAKKGGVPATVSPSGKYLKDDGSWDTPAGGSSLPAGLICMWSGTIATIPSGWNLCNGENGTPDLRDKFIVGAKQDDAGVAKTNITGALTQSGGANTHDHDNHSNHVFTQPDNHGNHVHSGSSAHANHTHTYTQVPNHVHPFTINSSTTDGTWASFDSSTTAGTGRNFNTSNPTGGVATGTTNNESASLTHGDTGNETSALAHANGAVDAHSAHSSENNIPTYYALAFIMKS